MVVYLLDLEALWASLALPHLPFDVALLGREHIALLSRAPTAGVSFGLISLK